MLRKMRFYFMGIDLGLLRQIPVEFLMLEYFLRWKFVIMFSDFEMGKRHSLLDVSLVGIILLEGKYLGRNIWDNFSRDVVKSIFK